MMQRDSSALRGVETRVLSKRAVTLVESLAILLCVTLLMVVLVPATAQVAVSGKSQRCLSNLMRIGYANAVYAAQDPNDNALPVHHQQFTQCGEDSSSLCDEPIFVGAYDWGGKSGVGRDDFVSGFPGEPLNSRYGTKAGFGPTRRPLNKILFPGAMTDAFAFGRFDRDQAHADTKLELDLVKCPSDTGFTGVHCPDFEAKKLSSFDHFGTSYNANIFMTASGGGGVMFSTSPYLHRMSDLLAPSRTLGYQENNGRFAWTVAPEPCDFLHGVPGTVGGWHGKDWTFNAAFMDGHADSIYMRGYRRETNLGLGPDFDGASRCITIRGEGWQKDTLPLPRIATNLVHDGNGRSSYEGCIQQSAAAAQRERNSTCTDCAR